MSRGRWLRLRGSAGLALLFVLSRPAAAAGLYPEPRDELRGGLEGGILVLSLNASGLPQFPLLWGGGATLGRGPVRLGFQVFTSSGSQEQFGLFQAFNLDLVSLSGEQIYEGILGAELNAGFSAWAGALALELRDHGALGRFDARNYGAGAHVGARWPKQSRVTFFARSGWLWLPLIGSWRGTLATFPSSRVDLNTPYAQAGAQIWF